MRASTRAIRFLQSLCIPEGPRAGQKVKLVPFQKRFVQGALDPASQVAVLSTGRGNAKTALSAGISLVALLGVWDVRDRAFAHMVTALTDAEAAGLDPAKVEKALVTTLHRALERASPFRKAGSIACYPRSYPWHTRESTPAGAHS